MPRTRRELEEAACAGARCAAPVSPPPLLERRRPAPLVLHRHRNLARGSGRGRVEPLRQAMEALRQLRVLGQRRADTGALVGRQAVAVVVENEIVVGNHDSLLQTWRSNTQLADGAEQRAFDVVDVGLGALGDLFELPAFDVLEDEGLPFGVREALHRDAQVAAEFVQRVLAFGRRDGRGFQGFVIERLFGAALAAAGEVDGRVQRDAMDPGIERRLAAELVAAIPGFDQRVLHCVRRQVRITRDAQAGVVPALAAFVQDGVEGVRLNPGFEKGEHGTWTVRRGKG